MLDTAFTVSGDYLLVGRVQILTTQHIHAHRTNNLNAKSTYWPLLQLAPCQLDYIES